MEISILPALLQLPVRRIAPAYKPNDKTGKFHAIKATNDALCLSVVREDLIVQAQINVAALGDPALFEIKSPGFAVVNGPSNEQFVMKNDSSVVIVAKFAAKDKKATKKPEEEVDTPEFTESGTWQYNFVGDKNRKWKGSLQSLDLPECDISIKVGDPKVVISGRDLIKYVKLTQAYSGKSTMSANWSIMLMDNIAGSIRLVATNGQQIGVSSFSGRSSAGDFKAILACDGLLDIAKLIDPESDVTISIPSKADGQTSLPMVHFSQDLIYANGKVGTLVIRVPQAAEKFHNFQGPIDKLSYCTNIGVKTQLLKAKCDMLDAVSKVRTKVSIDVKDQLALFTKVGAEGAIDEGMPMSLTFAKPAEKSDLDGNISLELSSRHLRQIADQCEQEEIAIDFTGPRTMARARVEKTDKSEVIVYFIPFKEE